MLELSQNALTMEHRRRLVIRLRRQVVWAALAADKLTLAASALRTLEEYSSAPVLDLRVALARRRGEGEQPVLKDYRRWSGEVKRVRSQILKSLAGHFGADRKSTERLKIAEAWLAKGKEIFPDGPKMWSERVLAVRYTGSAFGASLGLARQMLHTPTRFPFFFQLVHEGQYYVGARDLDAMLNRGRWAYGTEAEWRTRGWGVSDAEIAFCRAAYLIDKMIPALAPERRRALARKVLKALDQCWRHDPWALGATLLRAIAWSALGYPAECEADLATLKISDPILMPLHKQAGWREARQRR